MTPRPELESTQDLARTLLEALEARTFLVEADGTIVDLNDAAARAVRSTRDALIGTRLWEHLPGELARTRREALEGALREMQPRRIIDEEGGRIIDATVYPARRDDGAPPRVVILTQDVTEFRRAALTLERDAVRMREVIANLSDAYLESDPAGRVMMANQAAAGMFGYPSPEELVGAGVDGLWADVGRVGAMREVVWSGPGRFTDWVESGVRRDGSKFWGSINGAALRDEAGGVVGMQWVVRDVTERRRLRLQLQRSEAQLRAILDNMKDAFIQVDAAGRISRFSPSALEMYGYTAEEMAGLPVPSLYADATRRSEFLALLERTGRVDDWVVLAKRKDGATFWISLSAHLRRTEEGEDIIEAVVRDVTARKLTEQRIQESEARLRRILENLQDAYFQTDAAGRITMVSPSTVQMYGYGSLEEMIGMPAENLYADPPQRQQFLEEARRSGQIRDWIGEAKRKEGSTFWVSMSAQLLRDAAGEVVGTEGLVRDVTDRVRAEEERRQFQATLAQSDRLASMGMLAAGVAHEINNPLSYVLYNLESLAADLPGLEKSYRARARAAGAKPRSWARRAADPWADVGERFRNALEGTRRIRDIARGLRTFSRVDKEAIQPVDVRPPIESAIAVAYNEIKYRARLDKDLGAAALVLASEGKLSQVFLNLLVNAAHAIAEGNVERNRILVRTWQEGTTVRVEVRDTGCGIAPEHLSRIFEPFFTTKPIGVGSGLGLAIVRNIVEGFGGTVEVTSEPGKGTSVVVGLPAAAREQEALACAEKARRARRAAVRGRVLVVDDEAPLRYALTRLLRDHQVVEAESGEQACREVEKDPRFDVILCDMMMPSMNGVEFHRWLLAHQPALARRVVFVTGGAFTPLASDYLEQVENLRVEKPFDSNLPKLVGELVRAAKAERRPRR